MFKPEGVFAVMLTPFTKTGDVSEQEVRHLVDFLIGAGVDGLFPLGSAGESVHLSREEKVRTMGIIVDQARDQDDRGGKPRAPDRTAGEQADNRARVV